MAKHKKKSVGKIVEGNLERIKLEARDLSKEREEVCEPIARELFLRFAKRDDLPLGEATDQEVTDYYNQMYSEDFIPLVIENADFKISYLDHLFQLMHLIVDNVKARTEILLGRDYLKASVETARGIFKEISNHEPKLSFRSIKESEDVIEEYHLIANKVEDVVRSNPEMVAMSPGMSFTMIHGAIDDLKMRAAMTLNVRLDSLVSKSLGLNDKDDITIKDLSQKLTEFYEKKKNGDNSVDTKNE